VDRRGQETIPKGGEESREREVKGRKILYSSEVVFAKFKGRGGSQEGTTYRESKGRGEDGGIAEKGDEFIRHLKASWSREFGPAKGGVKKLRGRPL